MTAEIYIHIPFCLKKCGYCDFLSGPQDEETRGIYVSRLVKEIKESQWATEVTSVPTVFIGGGTPSILKEEELASIMKALFETFPIDKDAEITMECNPGTVTEGKIKAIRELGVNRLSIGLQSANDEELKILGRIHTYRDFLDTYSYARKAGFSNINVDLMNSLPYQKAEDYQETLNKIIGLKPEHISAYSLIVEEGTDFYELYAEDAELREAGEEPEILPSEEEERRMDTMSHDLLSEAGYERYEISNFALPGYRCRHNTGYWQRVDYIGFGLGASGLMRHVRYKNTEDLYTYLHGKPYPYNVETEPLGDYSEMEEFFFLGLRMDQGVSLKEFEDCFDVTAEEVYGELFPDLERGGFIEINGDIVKLTPYGRDLSNYVLAQFLMD